MIMVMMMMQLGQTHNPRRVQFFFKKNNTKLCPLEREKWSAATTIITGGDGDCLISEKEQKNCPFAYRIVSCRTVP